jgi:hypothetical protein
VKHPLARSSILFFLCCLAFGAAYLSVNRASGQGEAPEPVATADGTAAATTDPGLIATKETAGTPEDTSPPSATAPAETPEPGNAPRSFDELGEPAAAGSVFEKYGVRLHIPEGFGDFKVIYPVIVLWGLPEDAEHPNVVMTVYNPQTRSSLFLRFEDTADGPRPVELGRNVELPGADAAFDQIASTMEVAR